MYVLEEEFVRIASEKFEYGNSYAYLLTIGDKYKESGLTPIYIYDPEENSVYVTTEEKMNNKYHWVDNSDWLIMNMWYKYTWVA